MGVRILAWQTLTKAYPDFEHTYSIVNGVGPELLRMPRYNPDSALITAQVCAKIHMFWTTKDLISGQVFYNS